LLVTCGRERILIFVPGVPFPVTASAVSVFTADTYVLAECAILVPRSVIRFGLTSMPNFTIEFVVPSTKSC